MLRCGVIRCGVMVAMMVAMMVGGQPLELTYEFQSRDDCTGEYFAGGPIVPPETCTPSPCVATGLFSSKMVVCESTVAYGGQGFDSIIMLEYADEATCKAKSDPVSIWGLAGYVPPPPPPPPPPGPPDSSPPPPPPPPPSTPPPPFPAPVCRPIINPSTLNATGRFYLYVFYSPYNGLVKGGLTCTQITTRYAETYDNSFCAGTPTPFSFDYVCTDLANVEYFGTPTPQSRFQWFCRDAIGPYASGSVTSAAIAQQPCVLCPLCLLCLNVLILFILL